MQDIIEIEDKAIWWVDYDDRTDLIEVQAQDTIRYGWVENVREVQGWPATHLAWVESYWADDNGPGWALLNLDEKEDA